MTDEVTRERATQAARRQSIIRHARDAFLSTGYPSVAVGDVAAASGVSRASVYRYFPEGRSELYQAVAAELMSELRERLRYAANVPFSASKRLEHLLGALFAFFQDEPDAFRLLFRDVWSSNDPEVEATLLAERQLICAEIAEIIARPEVSATETAIAAAGILGFTLAAFEAAGGRNSDLETAWRLSCEHARVACGSNA